jgi:hypothetical protein
MKMIVIGLVAVLGVFLLVAGVLGVSLIGEYNTVSTLRLDYQAKLQANHGELDNVKKKISQVAQVSQGQLDQLDKLYSDYATARTGNSKTGSVMNWIKESIPTADQSTYKYVQTIIVSSRDNWTQRQTELVDKAREYNSYLVTFPGNIILPMMGFQIIVPQVVTSSSTERAFETGKDDDTTVFPKNQ